MKKSIYWIIPLLMMFGLGLYGCADSLREGKGEIPSDVTGPEGSEDGEWISYTMEFNASDMITPSLRALTEEQENDIQGNVRVLVFNTSDNKFEYEAPVTSVTPTGDKKAAGTVQLLLKHTDAAQYRFVMLANLPEGTPDAKDFENHTYDEVIKQFIYTMPSDGKWKGGDLPMWGEITAVVNHNKGANPKIGETIQLIRAVARIDVGLNLTAQGASQFNEKSNGLGDITMTSIKFYNMNDKGTVAPASSSLEENSTKVKAPTMPEGVTVSKKTFEMKSPEIKDGNLLQRSVYVPEAFNPEGEATQGANGETLPEADQANYMKRPYMVVGLRGACKNETNKVTYFRIDFLKRNNEEATATYEYLPLLRNFRYLVNITNVGGPGFDSEDEAKKGPAANIMYNVVVWNESEMSNVKYDGQYMLGVSEDHFKFYRDGGSIEIKAQTSWPDGLEVKNLPKWITYEIQDKENNKTEEKTIVFKIVESTTKDRTWPTDPSATPDIKNAAYIQAGRIRWFLHFEQKKDVKVSIQIYKDKECTQPIDFIEINQFGKGYNKSIEGKHITKDGKKLSAIEAKAYATFYVKTEPQNVEPKFEADAANNFHVERIGGPYPGSVYEYKVTAPDITDETAKGGIFKDPFDNFNTIFQFTVTHAVTGKSASKDITFLQKEYNAIPYLDQNLLESMLTRIDNNIYLMDGQPNKFFIKANTPYIVKLKNQKVTGTTEEPYVNQDVISFSKQNVENPSLGGKEVPFTPVNDISSEGAPHFYFAEVTFTIESSTSSFPPRDVKIFLISAKIQPEANCYLIKKDSKQGLLIPVSRVNTAKKYYDLLLNEDAKISSTSKKPKPLPGNNPDPYRLNHLDDDDDWTVSLVWSDMGKPSSYDDLSGAGIKKLVRFGGPGPDSYIYVLPNDIVGNALIEIRSGKLPKNPALWSWHIWVVDDYPTALHAKKSVLRPSDDNAAAEVYVMSHLLGAAESPQGKANFSNSDELYSTYGMQYQFGRKDPFPSYKHEQFKPFYDAEGYKFNFIANSKGDRRNFGGSDPIQAGGATYSMKQSIENPASIIQHQSMWMYETFPFGKVNYYWGKYTYRYIWNKYVPGFVDPLEKKNYQTYKGKTVFDPSPYGWRLMDYSESVLLKWAYYYPTYAPYLVTPQPGVIWDGDYTNDDTGKANTGFYTAISYPSPSSYYLRNSESIRTGWSLNNGSTDSHHLNRPVAMSVRPVLYKKDIPTKGISGEEDYEKYLPEYKAPANEGN